MVNKAGTATALVTDLDNTLWDWFDAWYSSFSAMLSRLAELSGIPQAELEPEMRKVHQRRGTAEYSYLLNEIPILNTSGAALALFDEAIHVQNAKRKAVTKLYPTVRETLEILKRHGVLIVAYTESLAYWTEWRIKHTGLDGVIDVLYSSPDHDLPSGVSVQDIRMRPEDDYGLKVTRHRHVPRGVLKPSVEILKSILADSHRSPAEVVYVGDSLMKDIAMAQAAGVLDVHAAYGLVQTRPEYELLRRVSHWTDADIERERRLARGEDVVPTYTLGNRFSEILPIFGIEEPGCPTPMEKQSS